MNKSIYEDIATRTGGDIYLGVTGPVRTGKSTFIKRFAETLVLPNMTDEFLIERTRDELPQSGSGKTVMTAEPKFVPEEAVEISPDGKAKLSVRLIDCVGYIVDGVAGITENGKERMITTPWSEEELPITKAAELGTKKVMESHCTVGLIVTTDGTVTDLPRQAYEEAESRAIGDMKKTGKPFAVIVNSEEPGAESAKALVSEIRSKWDVPCIAMNCLTMHEAEIKELLKAVLYHFPVSEVQFSYPGWLEALESTHPLKSALFTAIRESCAEIVRIGDAEQALSAIGDLEQVQKQELGFIDLGSGTVGCTLQFDGALFYELLSEKSGLTVEDDGDLMELLTEYASVKTSYERIAAAMEEAESTGYGIVLPTSDRLVLEQPQVVRKGSTYGIRLRASAPSIHMIRTDIKTEMCPMVGNESQTQQLITGMLEAYDTDIDALWQSNLFGKSVFELVSDGLNSKLTLMPPDARTKLKDALTKIVNDGCNGMICLTF